MEFCIPLSLNCILNLVAAGATGRVYKARAETVELCENVRNGMNSWVENETKELIKNFLQQGYFGGKDDYSNILLFVNALYFNELWETPFGESLTENKRFHLLGEETIKVPFLSAYHRTKPYGSFEDFKILELPYARGRDENKQFSMYVMLPDKPDKVDGLQGLVQRFRSDPELLCESLNLLHVQVSLHTILSCL